MNRRPEDFSAAQLAALYQDFATVRAFIAARAERITMVGPFAHRQRYAPRHAVRARFEYWRTQRLAAMYERVPLLGGPRHE